MESLKCLSCEDFSRAPKYAFQLQVRTNIHTTEQGNEWLSQIIYTQNVHTGIQEEVKASLKRCIIKYICTVSIKRKY